MGFSSFQSKKNCFIAFDITSVKIPKLNMVMVLGFHENGKTLVFSLAITYLDIYIQSCAKESLHF